MATSLFLSLELIYLMNWLIKNDKSRLRVLIKHALDNGLEAELVSLENTENFNIENADETLYKTFLEFLTYMEDALVDNLERKQKDHVIQGELSTQLKKLNVRNVNVRTLLRSVKQTRDALAKSADGTTKASSEETKKLLLKKLLQNWHPSKNDSVN